MESTPTTIEDAVFGTLTWERFDGWVAKKRFDFLRDYGSALRDYGEETVGSPFHPQRLFKEEAFKVVVRPPDWAQKQPPDGEQHDAWRKFVSNAEPIMGQIMDRALEAYVRQRPARMYWWERMYGADDPILRDALPEVHGVEELKAIVRPVQFLVYEVPARASPPTWIGIRLDAAFDRGGGFGVQLRDNQIVEFGANEMFEVLPNTDPSIGVPPFGKLRCFKGANWSGLVHFEPLARFRNLVHQREELAEHRRRDFVRPSPPWDFVDANFELSFVSPQEGKVAQEQIAAYNSFMADPQRSAEVVLHAIFDDYQRLIDVYREGLDEEEADRVMPRIDTVDGLRDLITFQTMTIGIPREDGVAASIGLGFDCSWDQEHGLYVRWREGAVEEIGGVGVWE